MFSGGVSVIEGGREWSVGCLRWIVRCLTVVAGVSVLEDPVTVHPGTRESIVRIRIV